MSDKKILSFNQSSPPQTGGSEPSDDRPVKQRLAAILAADVAGYTRLVEEDTEATVVAWQAARDDIIEPAVAGHEGRVIKLTGDGFLAEFPTVQAAVNCAIELQEGLRPGPLDFRIGVSMGDIIDDGRDVHGEGVNIAARLEALSDPGGICVSGDVYNQVRNRIDDAFDDWGEQKVKHVSRPIRVYALRRFVASGSQPPPSEVTPQNLTQTGMVRPTIIRWVFLALLLAVLAGGLWVFGPSLERVEQATQAEPPVSIASIDPPKVVENPVARTGKTTDRSFRDCDVCPEMTIVPAGTFKMGRNKGDADERFEHDMIITQDFAVGKYEITFEQWNACLAGGGCGAYQPDDKGWGQGNRPVIRVSWYDAQAYVAWLNGRTGKSYRLLTEAEWEYAARAGSSTRYPWGATIDAGKANYGNFRSKTVPVGNYDANSFALHDMIGNVWEWVADCYDKDAYQSHAANPGPVATGSDNCRRVLRGGAWDVDMSDGADLMRVSIREKGRPRGRYNNYGFRIARDLP